ncbi:MAG: LysM peptidoglycan-binding domain-containing protein, partial [Syntrophothermus sp.]
MTKRSKSSSCSLLPPIVAGLLAGVVLFAGLGAIQSDLLIGRSYAGAPGSRQQQAGNLSLPGKMVQQSDKSLVHIVARGQTIYAIARHYRVDMKTIVQLNGLKNPNRILAGQKLVIPLGTSRGSNAEDSFGPVFHQVQAGETLGLIAARYQVSLRAIMAANALKDPDYLFRGQRLLIPRREAGGRTALESPSASSPGADFPGDSAEWTAPGAGVGGQSGLSSGPVPPAAQPERRVQVASRGLVGGSRPAGTLDWPLNGPITSEFGPRWGRLHEGIDIAGPTGASVRAVLAGTVRQSGWVGGYGKLVVLDHGGGLETYYGHNSRLLVTRGMYV